MHVKLGLFVLLFCSILDSGEAIQIAKPGCQDKCGNVTIPYPFGIGSSCSIDTWAELKCDTTSRLFFSDSISNQIVELVVSNSQLVRIKNNVSTVCFERSHATLVSKSNLSLQNTPFTLSDTSKFIVIGCGVAGLSTLRYSRYGCATFCDGTIEDVNSEKCLGAGCCQMSLPTTRKIFNLTVEPRVGSLTTCGSVFLAEEGYKFKLKLADVKSLKDTIVALRFKIGTQTCEDAKKDPSSFACKGDSICSNVPDGAGYFCLCRPGYEGNPYLESGCQDVNECDDPQKHSCEYKCTNTLGSFRCENKPFQIIWIILGAGLGLFLVGGSVWMYCAKRKQLLELAEKLSQLNGRYLLIQEISSRAKIFTAKQLEHATNNFHESRILGHGGYGTVYKGILPDQSIVAIKKSNITEKVLFDDFINEVAILTKIDHRNIVKLFGCSVETEDPLLVYEFVSNGTLSDHIFKRNGIPYSSMSWDTRLRIAVEIAGALAYLHSAASTPIIHRDVKSSNILLDDHFTAKVADFGVSRLNHLDQAVISTKVKGTVGYLDPEYMLTSQLTEKSDVFSFGVVLAELLTGKRSIALERSHDEINLAIHFTVSMNEKRLLQIVEEGIVNEENLAQIHAVATLVLRCLDFKGEQRPSMKEVTSELEWVRGFSKNHPSSEKSNEARLDFTSNQTSLHSTNLTMEMFAR